MEIELRRNPSQRLSSSAPATRWPAPGSGSASGSSSPWTRSGSTSVNEGSITHALKLYAIWELPIGKGRKLLGNAHPVLDALFGGWQLATISRVQSGRMLDFGNVRLVGMSREGVPEGLQAALRRRGQGDLHAAPGHHRQHEPRVQRERDLADRVFLARRADRSLPSRPPTAADCIEMVDPTSTIQASTATAQFGYNYGPGKCGEGSLAVTGPTYWAADISSEKKFKLKGSATIYFRAELLNAFNHANFVPVTGAGGLVGFDARTGTDGHGLLEPELVPADQQHGPRCYAPRVAQLVAQVSF